MVTAKYLQSKNWWGTTKLDLISITDIEIEQVMPLNTIVNMENQIQNVKTLDASGNYWR
jgi:hypothetical protein